VSLTNATYQRSLDLRGELKRAVDVETECARLVADRQRALDLANEQRAAATARREQLEQEARKLAEQASTEVLSILKAKEETPPAGSGDVFRDPELYAATFQQPDNGKWGEGILNGHARVADSELPEF